MSNIYIQEPPCSGKVILKTSIGDIEIELWSKECPKACRNFIQLCMEGYYDGTIFHRIIKDFIAQGGDPTGTGQGGESIYGATFKDEFHSRLRFNRRGLVGMANAGKDDNASQFFFTLGTCQELNKKHTLFGKVGGNTIYNMIKLNECEVIDERPVRPEKILSAQIIYNPFDDIKPRNLRAVPQSKKQEDNEEQKKKGVKNYTLLSFGDEAEEDEENLETVAKELKLKPKSAHDIGDPSLISKKVVQDKDKEKVEASGSESESGENEEAEMSANDQIINEKKVDIESIKSKLKKKDESSNKSNIYSDNKVIEKKLDLEEIKRKETQMEIKKLQKELAINQKKATEEEIEKKEKIKEKAEETEVVKKYKEDVEKYEHLKKKKLKTNKEDKTMEMLNAFRERLFKAKSSIEDETKDDNQDEREEINESPSISSSHDLLKSILTHRLEVDEEIKQKVIDANVADNERYDIYDPRNPLNKRKREESREIIKEKKSGGSSASSLNYSSSRSNSNHHHHHHSSQSSRR